MRIVCNDMLLNRAVYFLLFPDFSEMMFTKG